MIENVYGREAEDAPAGTYVYPRQKLLLDLHNGLYLGSVKVAGQDVQKPYVLVTNRHDPQKWFDYVIEAMRHVLGEYPNASLVITGSFTEHTRVLVEFAKSLGVEEQVLFLGQVTEGELKRLYKNCAVYCYPSPQEDFGLGPLEAAGWGVPTVAWNHGGPTVTVKHGKTGYLAKPYEVRDYATYIIKLLKDPQLRVRMGEAAHEHARQNFTWRRHVDILEKAILNTLRKYV